jgi:hypothetical protein
VSFLGWADRSSRGSFTGAHPVRTSVEERRRGASAVVCAGTLACRHCDAPVVAGDRGLSLTDRLTCPFCGHWGPVRDFLSLAAPTRPARVVVRVTRPAVRP